MLPMLPLLVPSLTAYACCILVLAKSPAPPLPPPPKHTHPLILSHAPVTNVLRGQLGCCHERVVGVAQLVVALVALTQALQDLKRLIHSGLRNCHRLEAAARQQQDAPAGRLRSHASNSLAAAASLKK